MGLPRPSAADMEKGWKIDPAYLDKIARMVEREWTRPDWETVQGVLLAHAEALPTDVESPIGAA